MARASSMVERTSMRNGKEEAARVAMLDCEVYGQIARIAIHMAASAVKATGQDYLREPSLSIPG